MAIEIEHNETTKKKKKLQNERLSFYIGIFYSFVT